VGRGGAYYNGIGGSKSLNPIIQETFSNEHIYFLCKTTDNANRKNNQRDEEKSKEYQIQKAL